MLARIFHSTKALQCNKMSQFFVVQYLPAAVQFTDRRSCLFSCVTINSVSGEFIFEEWNEELINYELDCPDNHYSICWKCFFWQQLCGGAQVGTSEWQVKARERATRRQRAQMCSTNFQLVHWITRKRPQSIQKPTQELLSHHNKFLGVFCRFHTWTLWRNAAVCGEPKFVWLWQKIHWAEGILWIMETDEEAN